MSTYTATHFLAYPVGPFGVCDLLVKDGEGRFVSLAHVESETRDVYSHAEVHGRFAEAGLLRPIEHVDMFYVKPGIKAFVFSKDVLWIVEL